jgi:hypothetical protein
VGNDLVSNDSTSRYDVIRCHHQIHAVTMVVSNLNQRNMRVHEIAVKTSMEMFEGSIAVFQYASICIIYIHTSLALSLSICIIYIYIYVQPVGCG